MKKLLCLLMGVLLTTMSYAAAPTYIIRVTPDPQLDWVNASISGDYVSLDVSNFGGALSAADDNVQKAIDTLEDAVLGGGISQVNADVRYVNITGDTMTGALTGTGITMDYVHVAGVYQLPDYAPADNQIMKYDQALAQLRWEADAGAGISQADSDIRYVNITGDTMTGALSGTLITADYLYVTNDLTVSTILGVDSIDAAGAVDMDYGSADVTDHTFTTDGGTVVLDGSITAGGTDQSTFTEGLVVNDGSGGDEDDDFRVESTTGNIIDVDAGDDSLTGLYTWDLGGAGSNELVNSAAPTTDAAGEIALDTTIVDHQPLWQYYDGAENMTVIAIDTAELPATDNEIVKYDAGTDKFVLEADAGAGGGGATYREITFLPHTAGFDATNPAIVDWVTSSGTGTVRFPRAKFDDAEDDTQHYSFTMPSDATASAAWILEIHSYSDEDVDENVLWAVQVSATSDNDADNVEEQAADTADYQAENYDKAEAKAHCVVSMTIDYANCDGAVAGDEVNFIFYRDGDGTGGTDDHTNEVYLTRLHLKIPRS